MYLDKQLTFAAAPINCVYHLNLAVLITEVIDIKDTL